MSARHGVLHLARKKCRNRWTKSESSQTTKTAARRARQACRSPDSIMSFNSSVGAGVKICACEHVANQNAGRLQHMSCMATSKIGHARGFALQVRVIEDDRVGPGKKRVRSGALSESNLGRLVSIARRYCALAFIEGQVHRPGTGPGVLCGTPLYLLPEMNGCRRRE